MNFVPGNFRQLNRHEISLSLFTLVTIGNGGSRRSACSGVRH